jgi:hypothetical protein
MGTSRRAEKTGEPKQETWPHDETALRSAPADVAVSLHRDRIVKGWAARTPWLDAIFLFPDPGATSPFCEPDRL